MHIQPLQHLADKIYKYVYNTDAWGPIVINSVCVVCASTCPYPKHACPHRSVLPKLMECSTDDDVAMCFVSQASDFEKYLQFMVGQFQAEACLSDKNTQHFFQVTWPCIIFTCSHFADAFLAFLSYLEKKQTYLYKYFIFCSSFPPEIPRDWVGSPACRGA